MTTGRTGDNILSVDRFIPKEEKTVDSGHACLICSSRTYQPHKSLSFSERRRKIAKETGLLGLPLTGKIGRVRKQHAFIVLLSLHYSAVVCTVDCTLSLSVSPTPSLSPNTCITLSGLPHTILPCSLLTSLTVPSEYIYITHFTHNPKI